MASKTARPGRRLIVFALVVAALYGGVALSGEWKPKLGLDLQGGTRITLEALTDQGEKPSPAALDEARGIIDQRVNGTGVAESEVSTQGGQNIVVEIPGKPRRDLVDTVKQTAQLRFRLVAAVGAGKAQKASPSASPSGSASPGASPSASGKATPSVGPKASPSASPKGRPPFAGTTSPSPSPKAPATKQPTAAPSATPTAPQADPAGAPVSQPLKWMDNPGTKWLQKFAAYTCPSGKKAAAPVVDNKDQPLVTCDEDGNKLLALAGTDRGHPAEEGRGRHPAEPGAVGRQPDVRRRRPARRSPKSPAPSPTRPARSPDSRSSSRSSSTAR